MLYLGPLLFHFWRILGLVLMRFFRPYTIFPRRHQCLKAYSIVIYWTKDPVWVKPAKLLRARNSVNHKENNACMKYAHGCGKFSAQSLPIMPSCLTSLTSVKPLNFANFASDEDSQNWISAIVNFTLIVTIKLPAREIKYLQKWQNYSICEMKSLNNESVLQYLKNKSNSFIVVSTMAQPSWKLCSSYIP